MYSNPQAKPFATRLFLLRVNRGMMTYCLKAWRRIASEPTRIHQDQKTTTALQ